MNGQDRLQHRGEAVYHPRQDLDHIWISRIRITEGQGHVQLRRRLNAESVENRRVQHLNRYNRYQHWPREEEVQRSRSQNQTVDLLHRPRLMRR